MGAGALSMGLAQQGKDMDMARHRGRGGGVEESSQFPYKLEAGESESIKGRHIDQREREREKGWKEKCVSAIQNDR